MNWQTKARIQRAVSQLPNLVSYPLYYQIQRWAGAMRNQRIDPTSRLLAGLEVCNKIVLAGRSPVGATFFEVGAGWRLNLPIACWLCGADRITTVDLNPYLKPALVRRDLEWIRTNTKTLEAKMAPYNELIDRDRWQQLLSARPWTREEICDTFRIEYLAPADAGDTGLEADSFDYHVSNNTMEHIPGPVLEAIFHEARRITRPEGLLLHRVDHSDHFSHTDADISTINFLRYSDEEWSHWADNRYAYVNRWREDDYVNLFRRLGYEIADMESGLDPTAAQVIQKGFPLATQFADRDREMLTHIDSYFVLAPNKSVANSSAS